MVRPRHWHWQASIRGFLDLAGLRAAPVGTGAPKSPSARAPAIHPLKTILPLAGLAMLAGYGAYALFYYKALDGSGDHCQSPPPPSHWMNPHTFSPFRLAHKETVPLSNLIFLTLVPEKAYCLSRERLGLEPTLFRDRPAISHHVHLCSVEAMHPLVQIAREYTPLETGYMSGGLPALRLAVRVYPDGEMSRYLDSVPVGGAVRLRGPHAGFDVAARMGGDAEDRELVLVAGGTGILPVLRVLAGICSSATDKGAGGRPNKITVLWALRATSDFYLADPSSSAPPLQDHHVRDSEPGGSGACPDGLTRVYHDETQAAERRTHLSPMGNRLAILKQQLGAALSVSIFLDERGRCSIAARDIEQAMGLGGGSSARLPPPTAALCAIHNPSLTPTLGRNDTVMVRESEGGLADSITTCRCSSATVDEPVPRPGVGRNVLVVSGPDGFVEAVAGRMVYVGNMRSQGPVTGMVGAVARRNPGAEKDWIVLKLDG